MQVQPVVRDLWKMAPLPPEEDSSPEVIEKFQRLILAIQRPISDEDAKLLVEVFGEDGCFGLAASLVQRIETAPSWPIKECLTRIDNPWVSELILRANKGGL